GRELIAVGGLLGEGSEAAISVDADGEGAVRGDISLVASAIGIDGDALADDGCVWVFVDRVPGMQAVEGGFGGRGEERGAGVVGMMDKGLGATDDRGAVGDDVARVLRNAGRAAFDWRQGAQHGVV